MDRRMIALNALRKSLQLGHSARGGALQPGIQVGRSTLAQHLGKILRQRMEHADVGADLAELSAVRSLSASSSGRRKIIHAARRAETGVPSGVGGR